MISFYLIICITDLKIRIVSMAFPVNFIFEVVITTFYGYIVVSVPDIKCYFVAAIKFYSIESVSSTYFAPNNWILSRVTAIMLHICFKCLLLTFK